MSHRIYYNSTVDEGYAIGNDWDHDERRVAQSLARKRGLHVCTVAPAGHDETDVHFTVTLGSYCPGGGMSPEEEITIFLPYGEGN